ncbi:MAG: branched-chain amino acid ABC transporter permease [Candidatus Bathyarchaeia archaeon]
MHYDREFKWITSFNMCLIFAVGISLIGLLSGAATTAYCYAMIELMILAYSLNIFTGLSGYISFGHIIFYGLGAYTSAVLASIVGSPQVNPFIYVLAGGTFASLCALALGFPILRLRGDYFAIATLGVNEAVKVIIINTKALGEGRGISIYGYVPAYDIKSLYMFLLVILFAVIIASHLVSKSKFGYGLRAIRADEDVAEAMGVNTTKYKILLYAIGAFFAGSAGGVLTLLYAYAFPEYFAISRTVDMLIALVLGGFGTMLGPLIGSVIYYMVKDALLLRFPFYHQVIFGIVLIVLVRSFPAGIVGILNRILSKRLRSVRIE